MRAANRPQSGLWLTLALEPEKDMEKKESHSLRNTIIGTVAGGIILSLITPVRDFCLKTFVWVWSVVTWIWKSLISSYPVPGWVLFLVGLFALAGIVSMFRAFRSETPPEVARYTEDFLYGAKWRWSWLGNTISNLWCFCPHCDAQLVYDDNSCRPYSHQTPRTDFICEHCGNQVVASIPGGDKGYAVGAAQREIERRIRTNEHKKPL